MGDDWRIIAMSPGTTGTIQSTHLGRVMERRAGSRCGGRLTLQLHQPGADPGVVGRVVNQAGHLGGAEFVGRVAAIDHHPIAGA